MGRHARLAVFGSAILLVGCSSSKQNGVVDLTDVAEMSDDAKREALIDVRALAASNPSDPYWPQREAELCAALELDCTEPALERALAIEGRYAPALTLLSKHLYDQGRHEEAIDRLVGVAMTFPEGTDERSRIDAGLALHYDALGELEAADEIAARLQGGETDWETLGPVITFVKLRGDDAPSGTEPAARSLLADKKSAANLNNFGIAELQAGRPESAKKAFREAIDRNESLPGPYYNLAIVEKFYFFDDEAAADWFSRYWALSREDPDELAETFGFDPDTRVAEVED